MKTYSVKQIAEMLGTNPETVRRWIRDNKIKAVQTSRKEGNIVTEAELKRFVKVTPKYFSKLAASVGVATISPVIGIGALAGNVVAMTLLDYLDGKNRADIRIRPEDFKKYLQNNIVKLNSIIAKKQALIHQTETEINEIDKQIRQYTYLLENEDLLAETIEKANENTEE